MTTLCTAAMVFCSLTGATVYSDAQAALITDRIQLAQTGTKGSGKPSAADRKIAIMTERIARNGKDASAYNSCGVAWDDKRQFQKAIADYDKAIALVPDFPDPYHNKGIALRKTGRIREAFESTSMAIRLRPKYFGSY